MTQLEGRVEKGWGYEFIFATNNLYCGKMMVFEKTGAKFSMHFHHEKDETWFIQKGKFLLRWIDTKTATLFSQTLTQGMTWRNKPLLPHQLEALEDNSSITEVSTADSVEDNYRLIPGDSQEGLLDELKGKVSDEHPKDSME